MPLVADLKLRFGGTRLPARLYLPSLSTVPSGGAPLVLWLTVRNAGDPLCREVDMLGGFQDASRYRRHPRGRRFAFLDFDLAGLETAVRVDGKINDPSSTDRGWTVEMALPWKSLAFLFGGRALPPRAGETLRCDFSRFEAVRVHGKPLPENPGWSLNPHGAYDSHIPESFSVVHFTDEPAG